MRQTIALIVSVLIGLAAMFAMRSYIKNERREVTKGLDLINIAVAQRPLTIGNKVSKSMFKARPIPVDYYISNMIKMSELSSYSGKELGRNIMRNKMILKNDIRKSSVKLSRTLDVGERLVTVSVSNTTGVAGLIKPRSKVDIYYGLKDNVSLLLSKVRVYAVDSRTSAKTSSRSSRSSRGYSSLTLVVNPDEAALLIASQSFGELIFTLRNEHDAKVVTELSPIGVGEILSRAKNLNSARSSSGKR